MIYKLFYDVIKILILLNKKRRVLIDKNLFSFSAYAQEYCTVKCDIGRQIGKSTYIKTYADHKSLVVVWSKRMKQNFSNRNFDVVCSHDLVAGKKFPEYKTIYVDEPRFVFNNISISKFYDLLSKSYNQTYIWLGM